MHFKFIFDRFIVKVMRLNIVLKRHVFVWRSASGRCICFCGFIAGSNPGLASLFFLFFSLLFFKCEHFAQSFLEVIGVGFDCWFLFRCF